MEKRVCRECGTVLLGYEEFCPVCHKKSEFRGKENKRKEGRRKKLFNLFNEVAENDVEKRSDNGKR